MEILHPENVHALYRNQYQVHTLRRFSTIHHAYNINQRLYRLKQSKKIDCRTARKLLQTINYSCKRYYSGDMSPVDFLNILIDVESMRCELIGVNIVYNEMLHKLKIALSNELKFI